MCYFLHSGYSLYLNVTSTEAIINRHIGWGKKNAQKYGISGVPIDSHGICETTRAGESSREMQTQLQRVIKVPLSTIICEYFYVLLIWQRNDGQREIKMPLCVAIYSFVSTPRADTLPSFFSPTYETILVTRASFPLCLASCEKYFLTPHRVRHREFEATR